ncbi:MAG: hypothetical protein ACREKR_02250 [Candidatus Methylomirabilales bacterium]
MFAYLKENPWLLVFVLTLAAVAYLAWQNRAAEKVRSSIVTGVAVGLTGALITIPAGSSDIWLRLSIVASAALASILLIALKEESKKVEFPTIFVYESTTKRPLESLNDIYSYRFCGRTISCPPEFIVSRMGDTARNDGTNGDLYFDVMLRMFVDLLFGLYRNAWDLKVTHRSKYSHKTSSWEPHQGAPKPEFITREVFKRIFSESHALKVENFAAIGDKLAVPSGTRLHGRTESIGGSPYKRTLSLKNPYVEVEVEMIFSSFSRMGIGDLGLLLGVSREEGEKFSTYSCEIRLLAKFNRLRSGHPEMNRYRRWVDGMFEEIQEHFDSRRHWERGRDWFIMKKLGAIKEGP